METIESQFTAKLMYGKSVILRENSSDFQHLIASLTSRLQDEYSYANGVIIDNRSKKAIYRCRSTTSYD